MAGTAGNKNLGYPKGSASKGNAYKSRLTVKRADNPTDKGLWKRDLKPGN